MSRLRTGLSLLDAIRRSIRETNLAFLAAAVAFYGFVSIIPLFLLGLAITSFLGGTAMVTGLLEGGSEFLSPLALEIVNDAVSTRAGSGGATVVGVAVLAWSAIRVFRGLDVAFSHIYGATGAVPILDQMVDAATVFVGIPVAVLAAAVLGVVVPIIDVLPFSGVLGRIGLVAVLAIVFFPIFYRFPDVPVTVREAIPGTVLAAVGWTALATGFSLYATAIGQFHLYGALGAGLLLVTWLYLGGSLIMLGAVLNAVLAPGSDEETERTPGPEETGPEPAPDLGEVAREVREMREELESKTVSRSALEGDLKAYVRRRLRRGKARGWGPYLVLLYGTLMTLGAFYWLSGGWAILAMIVVWLSTLGLYVLMVLVGAGINAAGVPGRAVETVRDWRS